MVTFTIDDQETSARLMKKMLTKIDPDGTHLTAPNMETAFEILSDEVQVIFLDIEMPGINGLEAADLLQKKYPRLNVIFVTGHPEYAYQAHGVHPSGFLLKPVDETDILHELKHLRFPIEKAKSALKVRCRPFTVFYRNEIFDFKRDRTAELFAYLVYRNGALCTNGELLGILWDGNTEKQGHLRQLILDLRECLSEVRSENIIVKKYGKIGIDMSSIDYEGDLSEISEEFLWI